MSAAYYAKGMEIWKSPVITENGDGTTSISIGFQCATATEIVGEEGAQAIAEMMTLTADSAELTAEASARIAALSEENKRLRKALEPFVKMAGMMPLTHGPNNEPVSDDEPVSVSCCGFYLGDLTASNLNAVFNLEAKS